MSEEMGKFPDVEESACPKREDRLHCVHWYDDAEPCCACGHDPRRTELEIWKARAEFLYGILDDIDTADDLAKGNESLYRNLVRRHHARRFEAAGSDGYELQWKDQIPTRDPEDGITMKFNAK